MKNWYLTLAFAACIFLSSVAGAFYVVKSLKTELWENDIAITSSRNSQFDAQNAAALQLHNIEAAQRGDTDSIVRTNCLLLRSNLRGLEPKAFGPDREALVKIFIERANFTVVSLESQGACDWHSTNNK